jgi:hypothetical protein
VDEKQIKVRTKEVSSLNKAGNGKKEILWSKIKLQIFHVQGK